MQREEPEGIVISCDFCRRDWDGNEPMIEGHHGSILCLECLKVAMGQLQRFEGKYKCTLCLRFNIPATVPRWSKDGVMHDGVADGIAVACQECVLQAAKAFSKDPLNDWKWEPPPAN